MRRIVLWLVVLLLSDLVVACDGITPQANPPSLANTVVPGRWEVIPIISSTTQENESWKLIRVSVTLENKTFIYSAPRINVVNARMYTNLADYPAVLNETTGSHPSPITTIEFPKDMLVPPGFRVTGIYKNDAVKKFFFESRIPVHENPTRLSIPGYVSNVSLASNKSLSLPADISNRYIIAPLSTPVEIPSKAIMTVITMTKSAIGVESTEYPMHDKIVIRTQLQNIDSSNEVSINLYAHAIGNNGVLGNFASDEPANCKPPPYKLKASQLMTMTICTILPRGSTEVYVILTGDVWATYKLTQQ